MQNRYVAALLLVVAAALGAYFLWNSTAPKHYSSNDLGITFSYPPYYTPFGHTEETPEQTWSVLVLQDNDASRAPANSEGPPAITIIAFNNVHKESLSQWVRGSAFSNFKLSSGTLASTTIGGEEAVMYRYTGLYENDAAVVIHGGKIYFFSAGWLTEQDKIRKDFQKILESVRFTS
jgi:predicted Zn-dependent protease